MVNQNPTNHLRAQRQEMRPTLTPDPLGSSKLHVGFVGQRRRLESVSGRPFSQVRPRDSAQFRVYQRREIRERGRIAILPRSEQPGDVLGFVRRHAGIVPQRIFNIAAPSCIEFPDLGQEVVNHMNRPFNSFSTRSLLALAALSTGLIPQVGKAEAAQCWLQNSTLNGAYVANGSGTVTGVGAITTVALIIYNGDGTGTLVSRTTTVNGNASTASKIPVTFTVNQDCTGSKTIGSGAGATTMNFVITPDGDTITWIITNAGVTMSGTGVRLKR